MSPNLSNEGQELAKEFLFRRIGVYFERRKEKFSMTSSSWSISPDTFGLKSGAEIFLFLVTLLEGDSLLDRCLMSPLVR